METRRQPVPRTPALLPPLLLLFLVPALGNFTNPEDVKALEGLKAMIRKSNVFLEGWLEGDLDPCGPEGTCGVNDESLTETCAWQGLACIDWEVVGIRIQGNESRYLGGPLPTTLPRNLKLLSLPFNKLTGKLADNCMVDSTTGHAECEDRWNDLSNLEILELQANNISGRLPMWTNMEKLKTVNLRDNQLTGLLPNHWGEKSRLISVDLSHNDIGGILPESWGNLNLLQQLNLAWNMLAESIPHSWTNLKELRLLDLRGNCAICGDVKGRAPEQIFKTGMRAQGTNLKKDCKDCEGCDCDTMPLGFFTHALISLSVALVVLVLLCARRLCLRLRNGRDSANMSNMPEGPTVFVPPTMMEMKNEIPTLIVMPDGQEICMGKQIEEDRAYIVTDDSSINFSSGESTTSTESDTDSVDEDETVDDTSISYVNTSSQVGATESVLSHAISYAHTVGSESDADAYQCYDSDVESNEHRRCRSRHRQSDGQVHFTDEDVGSIAHSDPTIVSQDERARSASPGNVGQSIPQPLFRPLQSLRRVRRWHSDRLRRSENALGGRPQGDGERTIYTIHTASEGLPPHRQINRTSRLRWASRSRGASGDMAVIPTIDQNLGPLSAEERRQMVISALRQQENCLERGSAAGCLGST